MYSSRSVWGVKMSAKTAFTNCYERNRLDSQKVMQTEIHATGVSLNQMVFLVYRNCVSSQTQE